MQVFPSITCTPKDSSMARLFVCSVLYSTCFLISFYSWCYVFSSIHSESSSQLHSPSIHRLPHRTNSNTRAGYSWVVPKHPGECVLCARACPGSSEMTRQKFPKRRHSLQINITLMCGIWPYTAWFRIHFWWWTNLSWNCLVITPFFKGFWSCRNKKRCYWGVTGHPHYKREADLVTPTQLQDGLPLTGMSGSVILSAILLTEFSLLHPNNPPIICSNVFWTGIALQDDQEDLQRSPCSQIAD